MFSRFLNAIFKQIKRLLLMLTVFFIVSSLGLVIIFKYQPVPITAFMLYRHVVDFQHNKPYKNIKYRWVTATKISKHAYAAAIAAEDQLFYQHSGFDTESIFSAIATWLDGGRLRGASTISQQTAKNMFLIPSRSLWRKAIEAWFTVLIEAIWSKQRILEVYLNIAEFGDHLFGIEAASQHYFAIASRRLSKKQSALLAASLPNPSKLKVAKASPYMRQRQAWIMHQMTNLGY